MARIVLQKQVELGKGSATCRRTAASSIERLNTDGEMRNETQIQEGNRTREHRAIFKTPQP